jgi:hypothetical protein
MVSFRFKSIILIIMVFSVATIPTLGFSKSKVVNLNANVSELRIIRPEKKNQIKSLKLDVVMLTRKDRDLAEGEWEEAAIEGRFLNPNSVLMLEDKVVGTSLAKTVSFNAQIALAGEFTNVTFYQLDEEGNSISEDVIIQNMLWSDIKIARERVRLVDQKHAFVVSLGPSFISYRQTLYPDYRAFVATLKLGYLHKHSERVDFGVSSFLNAYPIYKNPNEITLRYFGMNLRGGYRLISKSPWVVRLMGGVYYMRTFVGGTDFGIKNMIGPQIYPMIAHSLDNGDAVIAYFKYSPMFFGKTIGGLTNRELASGISYRFPLSGNNKAVSIGLDYSNIKIESRNRTGLGSSWSTGVSYEF